MNTGQTAVRQAFVTLVMGSLMAFGPRPLLAQSPPLAGILTRPGQDVVIRGGWLFTGVSDARVRNTGILVRN
ncbi:MAG: hypothetical protein HY701_05440, partial [Gemmatimonadetes bacterium]|nr:hypothetical protein [Gemmatimonadota bacterium]